MKIVILLFMAAMLVAGNAVAASAPAPSADPAKKCAAPNATGCKSRARKKAIAKAKCEKIEDEAKREECLEPLEKKPEEPKASGDSAN